MSNGYGFDKQEPLQVTSVYFWNALNDYSSLAGTKSGSGFTGAFPAQPSEPLPMEPSSFLLDSF